MTESRTLADRLFDGHYAENELEEAIDAAGVPYESLGWDHYDCSLEVHGVPPEYRPSTEVIEIVRRAGFAKLYVNHTDKWETHYSFHNQHAPSEGWRVSYPHRRGDADNRILVEKVVETWPADWFESGKVAVVNN